MYYLSLFLVGFGLAVSGGVTIILYINLVPAGLSWLEYLQFISSRSECYLFLIGIVIIFFTIPKLSSLLK
ncbi:hypothetical protein GCM10011351_08300 [Paraliobacillus quinghaiensis]|uniref:Uncharacterized protein n=1 Tax=Paraliobacillus quinghaiensis TaxID=470815 RepID=A0A917WSD8_9BACI|nr:hypothetical protein [Paraliobacillus quinghaiensis]GGM24968.1 hypothetical protein GCM10011351_08300 [Paraliobacillus quinghaiensis]